MFQTNTLNLRLRLERNSGHMIGCRGIFYIELTGDSPFDVNKTFSEKYFNNSEVLPFFSLEDAAFFSEEMAAFWKLQLMANPKLDITGIKELADVWRSFAISLYPSNLGIPKQAVYQF